MLLLALDRAYKELGLIHRDISSLNIMLSGDGKCLLSDWDHAGTLDQRARGVVRTSASEFMYSFSRYCRAPSSSCPHGCSFPTVLRLTST